LQPAIDANDRLTFFLTVKLHSAIAMNLLCCIFAAQFRTTAIDTGYLNLLFALTIRCQTKLRLT